MHLPHPTLHKHWPEYLMEGFGLAMVMFVSGAITAVIEPNFQNDWPGIARRAVEAVFIAGTVVVLIYSPWGKRSGAHFNPAVTLTFYMLGRIAAWDAVSYVVCQFIGGVVGILVAGFVCGELLRQPPALWIVTQPGPYGVAAAFAGEFGIAFLLMTTVLVVSGHPRVERYTGLCAGLLVFNYILFEAPISGFSMNPARSFASAVVAHSWVAFWIYCTAPPAGMLAAAFVHHVGWRNIFGHPRRACAKLHHCETQRCIHCGYLPEKK
jgi:aquaporin Z